MTYDQLNVYYGDLHSHCHQVGYGYGSVEEAYQNARGQLDFASITAHAYWPDIPEGEARLAGTVTYHKEGFKRAAEAWPILKEATEAVYEPGRFVSFPSFEWHSRRYGDHNVYYKDAIGEIIRAADLEGMRSHLRRLKKQGIDCLMIPHHIGYLQGYRGISWADFTSEFSPVVEMFSMHGQAESDDAPYPYMHTMGPRNERSTMQYGLRTGQIFGVVGSTDHHSAFPGSYGYGRAAVWASELTREAIWEAIVARRTYAITVTEFCWPFLLMTGLWGPSFHIVRNVKSRSRLLEVERWSLWKCSTTIVLFIDGQFQHNHESPNQDWYYVRVCQKNGQWAWSSPIWIDGS